MNKKTLLTFGGLALGLAFGGAAGAQDGTPAAMTASAPYLLAADDSLSIKVVNFDNLSTEAVVAPDGTIAVPLLGPVNVTGKTVAEVARLLTTQWREYVVSPSVSVSLTQKRKQDDVMFYGNGAKAGAEPFRPTLHIIEALAELGGAPAGDLSAVTLTHADGQSRTLDLSHPETKGGTDADVLLRPGDVVYIPERRDQFSVLGEVTQPGSFDYKDDMTVLDALTKVGGVKETADLANASLVHDGRERPLDLDALLRKGDLSINTKLASGDRILVPEIHNRTYVFGSVGHAGYYTFKPGDRVLDALNASGPTPDADLSKVNVIRVDKAKNTAKMARVDLKKFLTQGDMTGNVPLQPGDVLYIPDKHKTFSFQDVLGMASSLSVVGVVKNVLTGGL